MARKSTIVIALLLAVGFVVAMLPAQESPRRRASVYNVTSDDPAVDLAPAPEPGLMPVDAAASTPEPMQPSGSVAQAGILGRRRSGGSL
ncbi:MAG: hypothetical protein WD872_10205, partial [Pirellulaceae bacterium]